MAKLLIVPFVCLLEYLFYSKKFTIPIVLSIFIVVLGVGVITVTSITASFLGFTVAMLSVLATGIQQTKCNAIQKKHGISPFGLLLKAGYPMVGRFASFAIFASAQKSQQWSISEQKASC